MVKVITVVLRKDGHFHSVSERISLADAERWVDEGFRVFRFISDREKWAVNEVGSGKIFTSETHTDPYIKADVPAEMFLQLTRKD